MIEIPRLVFLLLLEIPLIFFAVIVFLIRSSRRTRTALRDLAQARENDGIAESAARADELIALRGRIQELETAARDDAETINRLHAEIEELKNSAPALPETEANEPDGAPPEEPAAFTGVAEAHKILVNLTSDDGALFDLMMQGNDSLGLIKEGKADEATKAFGIFLEGLDRLSGDVERARNLLEGAGGEDSGAAAAPRTDCRGTGKPSAYYIRTIVQEDEEHLKTLRARILELGDAVQELSGYKEQHPELTDTLARFEETNRQLGLCITTLEQENERLNNELAKLGQETGDGEKATMLEDFNRQLEERIVELETELAEKEAALEQTRNNMLKLEKEYDTLYGQTMAQGAEK